VDILWGFVTGAQCPVTRKSYFLYR